MITLCIRYTLDAGRLADFEAYARSLAAPIERCGGKVVGYYAPTKFAGPTNIGLALIDFASLAAYERIAKHWRPIRTISRRCAAPKRRAAFSSRTGRSSNA